jgi:hypothetical protein
MTMSQAVSRTPSALARRDLGARQVIVAACVAMVVITGIDVADGRLGLLFSVGFVLVAVTAPLSVDVRSLFPTGVLPPALLIGALAVVAAVWPDAIHVEGLSADAGVVGRLLASIVDLGLTLVVGHALALAVIAARVLTAPTR